MITVFVPDVVTTGHFEVCTTINGDAKMVTYEPRLHNGHRVIDVPTRFFQSLLNGTDGLLWEHANPEAMAWLGENQGHGYFGTPFPGADRPSPVAPIQAIPVTVKLRAPGGLSSFSHDGVEHKIGKDGTTTVDERVGNVLRSHGFMPA